MTEWRFVRGAAARQALRELSRMRRGLRVGGVEGGWGGVRRRMRNDGRNEGEIEPHHGEPDMRNAASGKCTALKIYTYLEDEWKAHTTLKASLKRCNDGFKITINLISISVSVTLRSYLPCFHNCRLTFSIKKKFLTYCVFFPFIASTRYCVLASHIRRKRSERRKPAGNDARKQRRKSQEAKRKREAWGRETLQRKTWDKEAPKRGERDTGV